MTLAIWLGGTAGEPTLKITEEDDMSTPLGRQLDAELKVVRHNAKLSYEVFARWLIAGKLVLADEKATHDEAAARTDA